ncbi:hypothetical protein D1872_288700 [compost metagenome]
MRAVDVLHIDLRTVLPKQLGHQTFMAGVRVVDHPILIQQIVDRAAVAPWMLMAGHHGHAVRQNLLADELRARQQ